MGKVSIWSNKKKKRVYYAINILVIRRNQVIIGSKFFGCAWCQHVSIFFFYPTIKPFWYRVRLLYFALYKNNLFLTKEEHSREQLSAVAVIKIAREKKKK
jgi:hypothetical protein